MIALVSWNDACIVKRGMNKVEENVACFVKKVNVVVIISFSCSLLLFSLTTREALHTFSSRFSSLSN